jgi:8-oxo-dGTP pyrophosphatase MutT (NUDIX family)
VASGDFSGLKKVGPQGGSNPGGVYEESDGTRWYVKSQKSELHGKNEALAAAFYRMAGIGVPEVVQGQGTPGLPGSAHTASKMVPGAKQPFPAALGDKAALSEMREGFALDAWLANWDVAGLTYDNVVKGSDGKLYRIDVGGSLLFRAQGGEKGNAFGDKTTEFESLRDDTNYVSKSIFGGMSDEEIASSVEKVEAITPDQIKKMVADFGMQPSLADRLIARREDLLSRVPKKKSSKKAPSPEFTILPKDQRGKSGDGYFAPKIWGKYGAAGVMMRNVDENGVERFLLVKANTQNSKRWQLPGGALEELETPEQGAAREVHEELGFTQDFLHDMTPIGTHKVAVDVPGIGTWHYSNIAVDVPNMPELTWDKGELGGAQWFTSAELEKLGADGEIHPALTANLTQVLGKFPLPDDHSPTAPAPAPVPTISPTSSAKQTTWTKGKFNTTLAYKTSFENREVVGVAEINGDTKRILWEDGKFRSYRHIFDKGWQYEDTWTSKKAALDAFKNAPFYRPPAGTMADTNKDFISADILSQGGSAVTTTDSADVLQELLDAVPMSSGAPEINAFTQSTAQNVFGITLAPWSSGLKEADGKPFPGYKTSYMGLNKSGQHIGALHETPEGHWKASGANGRGAYIDQMLLHPNLNQALQALANAEAKYVQANGSPAPSPLPPAAVVKKTPKLTATQIEKQNGVIPKTLKGAQKSTFLKNLKENSPFGFVHSNDPDIHKVFSALVHAVKKHNETQSPKLNYLQGANLLDEKYGSKQKANLIAWLQTSEGKTFAPSIISGGSAHSGTVIPADYTPGLKSPYEIGTPQKVASNQFRTMSNTDMRDLFADMYAKNPLTSEQRSMISAYKGSSGDFNEPLRGEDTLNSYNLGKINALQAAMRPSTESFVVWRGTDGLGSAINKHTIKSLDDLKKFEGAVVGDPAFFSSAFDPSAKFSGKRFTLIVSVPKGTPSTIAWAATPSFDHEKEVVLAAGLHYKIERVEQVGPDNYSNHYNLYLTVVPEAKKK